MKKGIVSLVLDFVLGGAVIMMMSYFLMGFMSKIFKLLF